MNLSQSSNFVLDNMRTGPSAPDRHRAESLGEIDASAAVGTGTLGAEYVQMSWSGPEGSRCDRVDHDDSNGFIAAQPRRVSRVTSRALLLLPPSLVRSGALRSDIYADRPASPPIALAARQELGA